MKLDKEFIVKVTDGLTETAIDAAETVLDAAETIVEEAKNTTQAGKKKCAGNKCKNPKCKPSIRERRSAKAIERKKSDSYGDKELRAKCLELALKTTRLEDDAVKWAKRYWKFVQKGD